jgi:hypothetical protein
MAGTSSRRGSGLILFLCFRSALYKTHNVDIHHNFAAGPTDVISLYSSLESSTSVNKSPYQKQG